MTTIAAGRLAETLQTLIDARLDTIDRMLQGRVNRHDRLAIVREVETQIFDLLGSRDADALDRDDVLAVLARLDPPEAYLPDEATGEVGQVRFASASRPGRVTAGVQARPPRMGGILGIVSIVMGLVVIVLYITLATMPVTGIVGSIAETLFFGNIFGSFVVSLLAVITAAWGRLKGGWAIAGLVTGIVSMLGTVIGTFALFAG